MASCTTVPGRRHSSRPLGLADLTVMSALSRDYPATLRAVAAMGYTHFGFRLAGYGKSAAPELPPAEKARLVHDAGLAVGVVRYGYGRSFAEQARDAQAIGASIIAYSAAPVFFRGPALGQTTRAAFDAWLPELGTMARIAQDHGLTLAYHNHWWDHAPLEGETPLDLIAAAFSPAQVAFEIDLAWAWVGGVDPLALVTRLGARVVSLHLKDVDPSRGADRMRQLVEPGAGRLDYAALLPRLDRVTDAIGYVEVDTPADGMTAAANASRFLHNVRGDRA
ncbi:sugar phosphate isomerase/epimerase family protein [Novosphingobium soli]|uniref:sugar phosphate isomerase/epimerase family protein n=1 Tax=Novosphingobium soli TaxID=574956 RepID=UPI0036D2A6E0